MGLDVMVLKCVVPPQEVLDGGQEARDKWCEENRCEIKIIEKDFPKELEKLSRTPWLFEYSDETRIDWNATFSAKGLKYEDYEWDYESDSFGFSLKGSEGKTTVDIPYGELKLFTERVKAICISQKEYGYQRKGANGQFYEDGKWEDDTIVTTRKELLDDWRRYFGRKKEFHDNIVKNFREGEHIVVYW